MTEQFYPGRRVRVRKDGAFAQDCNLGEGVIVRYEFADVFSVSFANGVVHRYCVCEACRGIEVVESLLSFAGRRRGR